MGNDLPSPAGVYTTTFAGVYATTAWAGAGAPERLQPSVIKYISFEYPGYPEDNTTLDAIMELYDGGVIKWYVESKNIPSVGRFVYSVRSDKSCLLIAVRD